jgi:Trp operon repressor
MKALIGDLLSETEIGNIEARWSIAQSFLATDCSQNEAMRHHEASQDQVNRVYEALNPKQPSKRQMGYRLAYRRLFGEPAEKTSAV